MKNILIDCDPGHDDAIALLMAAKSEELNLLGVTTVAGNCPLDDATRNALDVLDYADAAYVPVYAGCGKPLMREPYYAPQIHGKRGLGGYDLPAATAKAREGHAVDFIVNTLRNAEEQVTVVAIGPLTNIAMAFSIAPDIKDKIDKLVIMGGAVRAPGNVTSAAEFNCYCDPEAAKIVLESGCDTWLVALDVTMQALVYGEEIAKLKKSGSKTGRMAGGLLDHYWARYQESDPGIKGCPVHDALCIGWLMDQTLVEFEQVHIDVSIDSLTRGETVSDINGRLGLVPNIHLSKTVDRDRFSQMIYAVLG